MARCVFVFAYVRIISVCMTNFFGFGIDARQKEPKQGARVLCAHVCDKNVRVCAVCVCLCLLIVFECVYGYARARKTSTLHQSRNTSQPSPRINHQQTTTYYQIPTTNHQVQAFLQLSKTVTKNSHHPPTTHKAHITNQQPPTKYHQPSPTIHSTQATNHRPTTNHPTTSKQPSALSRQPSMRQPTNLA